MMEDCNKDVYIILYLSVQSMIDNDEELCLSQCQEVSEPW